MGERIFGNGLMSAGMVLLMKFILFLCPSVANAWSVNPNRAGLLDVA